MAKQPERNEDRYFDTFPTMLRGLLEKHPKDGHQTTYKALGEAVGVRQQTISQYASGQTQPTADVILKIAQFFDVSVDYLLTGVSSNNKKFNEELGLSESAIEYLKRANSYYKKDPENEKNITYLDKLLSDRDFYAFLDDFISHIEGLRNIQMNRDAVQDKYSGLNVEGYFKWSLQMEMQEFIQKEIEKLGLDIEAE